MSRETGLESVERVSPTGPASKIAAELSSQISSAADEIDRIAKLPTLDGARALLMSVMLAPIPKLARTFNEVPGKLVRTLAAVRDSKEA